MKNTMLFVLLTVFIAGCNKMETKGTSASSADSLKVPVEKYLSDQQLQKQVDQEIKDLLSLANDARVSDANEIITLTGKAVQNILDSTYNKAIDNLEAAVGKAEVLTTAKPELSLIPLDVEVTTRDLVADIDAVNEIRMESEILMKKGYMQEARHLLSDMASEIEISSPMLPMSTFPSALSLSARELKNNNPDKALIVLNTALTTVIEKKWYVPLPLIRAERMLAEVSTLLEKGDKTKEVETVLENAEYQIRFAEALGYGEHDKEFKDMYVAIKQIKQELRKESQGDSAGMTSKLREKLKTFKDRISKQKE